MVEARAFNYAQEKVTAGGFHAGPEEGVQRERCKEEIQAGSAEEEGRRSMSISPPNPDAEVESAKVLKLRTSQRFYACLLHLSMYWSERNATCVAVSKV